MFVEGGRRDGLTEQFYRQAQINNKRRALESEAKAVLRSRKAPRDVMETVIETARAYDASPLDIVSCCRTMRVVRARHSAIYKIKADRPMRSTPRIASWFGMDHTSILFALASHSERNGLPKLSNYHIDVVKRRNRANAASKRRSPVQSDRGTR